MDADKIARALGAGPHSRLPASFYCNLVLMPSRRSLRESVRAYKAKAAGLKTPACRFAAVSSLRSAAITDYCTGASGGGVTAAAGWLRGAAVPRSANGTQETLTSPLTKVWQAMR